MLLTHAPGYYFGAAHPLPLFLHGYAVMSDAGARPGGGGGAATGTPGLSTGTGAVKLYVSDLLSATPVNAMPVNDVFELRGVRFSKVWLQARFGPLAGLSASHPAPGSGRLCHPRPRAAEPGRRLRHVAPSSRTCCSDISRAALLTVRLPPTMRATVAQLAAARQELGAVGMLLLVIGKPVPPKGAGTGSARQLLPSRVVDLSDSPNRETLWMLEIEELWRDVLQAV